MTRVLPRAQGLTNGNDAIAFTHADNWVYSGSVTSGDAALLRAAIADESSWTSDDYNLQSYASMSFAVSPAPPPTPPEKPPSPPSPPSPPMPPPRPPLQAGDCMVVSLLLDYDDFGIVLLAPLGPGQSIWVTDDGWDSSTGKFLSESPSTFAGYEDSFYGGDPYESHFVHTATTDEPAGTVLRRADFTASEGSGDTLYDSSDQLLVYQGTQPTISGYNAPNGGDPTFLCALDLSTGYSFSQCSAPDPSPGWAATITCDEYYTEYHQCFSKVPHGLIEGVDALAFTPIRSTFDVSTNWAYKQTGALMVGTADALRLAIADPTNWNSDDWTGSSEPPAELTPPPAFTVISDSPPSPPSPSSPSPLPTPPKPPATPPASPPIACPCLTEFPAEVQGTANLVNATIQGITYSYPASYGLDNCSAHDVLLPPFCNVTTTNDTFAPLHNPFSCSNAWCFVDTTQCNVQTEETMILGVNMSYSYAACEPRNIFNEFWRFIQPRPPPPSPPLPSSPPPPSPPPAAPPLPPLQAGDCMVVGMNMDSVSASTQFGIVLLAAVGTGVTLSVTDDGWDARTNAFNSDAAATNAGSDRSGVPYDSHVTFTTSSMQLAGTVLTGTSFSSTLSLQSDYADQLLVYTGSKAAPTFLCALDLSTGLTNSQGCTPNPSPGWTDVVCNPNSYKSEINYAYYSSLPAGLSNGVNAPSFNPTDNWGYAGETSGDANALRAAIADESNWDSSDRLVQTLPGGFTVMPPPPPSPPLPPSPPPAPPPPPADPPLAPLQPGDCMVTYLGLDYDDFGIVLLSTLGQGQSIWVTDDGWDTSTGKFLSESSSTFAGDSGGLYDTPYEAHLVHTAATDEPAGTVLRRADFSSNPEFPDFPLDGSADQILVYQGTVPAQPTNSSGYDAPNGASPTFLCALDLSGGYSTSQCSAPDPSTGWASTITCNSYYAQDYRYWSGLPQGLTDGVDALAFSPTRPILSPKVNWAYQQSAPTNGRVSELRAAIANSANWHEDDWAGSSSTPASMEPPASFTVLPDLPHMPPMPPMPPFSPPVPPPPSQPPPLPPPPSPPPSPPLPPPPPSQPPLAPPPAPLQAGDCMVVALHLDYKQFALVLLAPLGPGQSIWVTDDGWDTSTGKFVGESWLTYAGAGYAGPSFSDGPYERHAQHVATGDEPAGTVLTAADFGGALTSLDHFSDQLLVYRGTQPTTSGYDAPNGGDPTFLCALDLSAGHSSMHCAAPNPSSGWASDMRCIGHPLAGGHGDDYSINGTTLMAQQTDGDDADEHGGVGYEGDGGSAAFLQAKTGYRYWSSLPRNLTAGVDALAFEPYRRRWYDNAVNWAYKPLAPTTGTADELRAAISNASNWHSDKWSSDAGSTVPLELIPPTAFIVLDPDIPFPPPPPPPPPPLPSPSLPPPPSPPPPPPPLSPRSTIHFELIASGDVSDYGPTEIASVEQSVATAAGVDASAVTVTVRAASVVLDANIVVTVDGSASVKTAMEEQLASASTATQMLSGVTIGGESIEVETVSQAPELVIDGVQPDAPASEEGAPASEEEGCNTGCVVGLSVGIPLSLLFCAFVYYYRNPLKKFAEEKGTAVKAFANDKGLTGHRRQTAIPATPAVARTSRPDGDGSQPVVSTLAPTLAPSEPVRSQISIAASSSSKSMAAAECSPPQGEPVRDAALVADATTAVDAAPAPSAGAEAMAEASAERSAARATSYASRSASLSGSSREESMLAAAATTLPASTKSLIPGSAPDALVQQHHAATSSSLVAPSTSPPVATRAYDSSPALVPPPANPGTAEVPIRTSFAAQGTAVVDIV